MAGIYIHIPFCRQACTYCNFYFSTSLKQKDDFLSALQKEIALQKDFISRGEKIDTIYIGGGTPSLLTNKELTALLDSLKKSFDVNPFAEITLEANPDDISPLVLQGWLQTGINRLSVGVQSFDENELKWMNRAHTAKDSLQSIVEIKEAGFANFSVDLIFGSPLLSDYNLTKNIGLLVQMEVPHLSCYALTVEPRTALHKMIELKKSMPVDNEKQAIQFLLTMQLLKEAGYEQYEISNYAKVGYRSKHNSSYWQGVPYFGLGPSAHSFNGKNMRRWNKSNVAFYIESLKKNEIPYEEEVLSITQQLNEYIMTALRTTEGVNTLHIKKHFGEDRAKAFTDNCDLFVKEENLSRNDLDFFVLSEKGKLFADGIAAALFFE